MDTSNEKEHTSPIVPLVIGAAAGAAGAAIAYLLSTKSNNADEGNKLTETLSKGWEALKEKAPFIEDELNSLKDKIMHTVQATLQAQSEQAQQEVHEAE